MANEIKFAGLTSLQTFLSNCKNLFATKTDVDELSTDVAYINVEDNENVENPDIESDSIVVDSALSETSTNPVQNKVVTAEINSLSEAIAGLTLGVHTDGLVYIFKDGAPIGNGVQVGSDGDVVGYVDSANNIVVKGNLADGTYTVKYEMDDGSTVDIGDLVLDSNVYYSVTNNLTNCVNSNSATQAIGGQGYTATITALDGYELSSVVATMGGEAVTVTDGVINIADVTGNIVITAVAEEIKANYTNLADPASADWWTDCRIGSDGTKRTGVTGGVVTNYIELHEGDVVRVKGLDLVNQIGTENAHYVGIYNTSKVVQSVAAFTSQTGNFSDITATATGGQATVTNGVTGDALLIKFAGKLNGTANDVIITVNEPID